jgi:hypothetical protein
MYNQIVLILILAMLLLGMAMTFIPVPVLWGMACLIFLALSLDERRAHQG